jgi:hypothetical protein
MDLTRRAKDEKAQSQKGILAARQPPLIDEKAGREIEVTQIETMETDSEAEPATRHGGPSTMPAVARPNINAPSRGSTTGPAIEKPGVLAVSIRRRENSRAHAGPDGTGSARHARVPANYVEDTMVQG